jgi:hypothetical protein
MNKYFTAIDKSTLSEPTNREVRLLKPSHLSELTMDSVGVGSESNSVTAEEEVMKIFNRNLCYKESVRSRRVVIQGVFRRHIAPGSSGAPVDDDGECRLYTPFCSSMMKCALPMQN